jgi:hypothetical protein
VRSTSYAERATSAARAGRGSLVVLHATASTAHYRGMNLSISSVRDFVPTAPLPKVGTLQTSWHHDEDLALGGVAGPQAGFASLDDALAGAAGLSQERGDGATFAVTSSGGHFQAHELLQPVWTKTFSHEYINGYDNARLVPLNDYASGDAKVGFSAYRADKYGQREDAERTGHVELIDPSVAAVVGNDWAIVDGELRSVQGSRPQPPIPPQPPVDPRPPVDPKPPVDPRPPVRPGMALVQDVTEAVRLATESARIITTVSPTDKGEETSKDTRIKAYKTNLAAQSRLEKQFNINSNPANVVSTLRTADASLEDANWQLAKKPSPDGRFNGVDQPGALRDTQKAVDLLNGLLTSLTEPAAA